MHGGGKYHFQTPCGMKIQLHLTNSRKILMNKDISVKR